MLHSALESEPQVGLPLVPPSWYYVGSQQEIARGPRRFNLPGGSTYVAFQVPGGPVAVLDGRCCHLGADLALGCVQHGRLACPMHGWEFAADGRCEHIPASAAIPAAARVASFPVEVCGGQVFFFNAANARFPFPFFRGVGQADLLAARAFEFTVDAPWYLVGANGFDIQHFRCAHDRTLLDEPAVDSPDPFSWRLRARFRVTGDSWQDRLIRRFSGPEVEMSVENWCGNLVLVTAKFRRTTSYGMVSFAPLEGQRTRIRNIVWVPRSRGAFGRRFIDPLDAVVRRWFIREFVRSDVQRSAGIRYHPGRMIGADKVLVGYLSWLQDVHLTPPPEIS